MAFQRAINTSLSIPPNATVYPTSVRPEGVIPDGLVTARMLSLSGGNQIDPTGAFLEIIGGDSLDLLEVKAQRRRITLSTGRRQILGFIDVLAQKRLHGALINSMGGPRPGLLLVTPADTEVSEDVSFAAAQRGVAIYQALVEEAAGRLSVGPFIQRTGFADVPQQFQFPSIPVPLEKR
jgi:hypothetical protein